jgi:hypothetical protein
MVEGRDIRHRGLEGSENGAAPDASSDEVSPSEA